MNNKSIKKNYFYNVAYQMLNLFIPLLTTPYLSRTLGAEGIGIYSFSVSIVTYFTLFATMGTATYGQREISYYQNDRQKRTEVFWNTEIFSCITTVIVLVFYSIFIVLFSNNDTIYLILSINIFLVAFDITWLYRGLEEFGYIILYNIVFKIINIILIFLFVNTKTDLIIYILIIAIIPFVGMLPLWLHLKKWIDKPNWKNINPFVNFKVIISLFIPTIAISIYTVLDKTMLGIITKNEIENGYYEQALKLVRTALTLITALGTVMISKIGNFYEQEEEFFLKKYIYKSYQYVWFLGIPLCLGMIAISDNMVPWFYGEGFDKIVPLLNILSFLILAIGISNVTGMQYMIPTKRERLFTYTVMTGAILNVILNMSLIPRLYSIGAAISSLIAESCISIIQIVLVRKEICFRKIIKSSINYWFSGLLMLIIVKILGHFCEPGIVNTLCMILVGLISYIICLSIIKDQFFLEQFIKIKKSIILFTFHSRK